jgi:cysteinyl-tRNA synthetase
MSKVLGLTLEAQTGDQAGAAPFIDLLLEVRSELRKEKLWTLSELVRDRLNELGVTIEDTKAGTTWRWE